MSLSLQQLRERALTRTQDAVLRRQIVLDDTLEQQVTVAREHAVNARNRVALYDKEQQDRAEQETGPDNRYGAVPEDTRRAALEEAASDAETAAETAAQAALAASVHLVFKRLPPDEYQALLFQHIAKDGEQLDIEKFKSTLADVCYLRCESSDGEDLGITWQEAQTGMLSHGDREHLQNEVIAHNRQVVIHPS